MGLLALFRRTPTSASVAKERLRIIVAQERSARGGPDYLPLLRRELLQVIHKYVNVDPEAVRSTSGRRKVTRCSSSAWRCRKRPGVARGQPRRRGDGASLRPAASW